MAEIATVAFETNDLIAALVGEVEEIVTMIARPVGWPTQIAASAPVPTEKAAVEPAAGWQGRVPPP